MDPIERFGDSEEALRVAMEGLRSGLWTSMPGLIQGFDPATLTASVQISIKGVVNGIDGKSQFVDMPLLVHVPVHFPRGGNCTLTFPVTQGDECLVVFAARCIDGWWQSGGIQAPMEPRMHDLSDGFAFVGFFSQATKIAVSTTSAQLRSNDGTTFIDLNPATQKVRIVAPGGFDVVAPLSTFSAAVTIQGLLTWAGGMIGSIGSGVAARITGAINFIGTLTSNGKNISDSHTHNGVQPGSGNSGTVN